jgi:hypothetical protein
LSWSDLTANSTGWRSRKSEANSVKGLCRDKLTKNELGWMIEAHNELEDILTEVWKPN